MRYCSVVCFVISCLLSPTVLFANDWKSAANLDTPRYLSTSTLLFSGKILVVGGTSGTSLRNSELFDPTTGTWTSTGLLNTPRHWHSATLLPSGKVLVVGGNSNGTSVSSAEIYDPASEIWSPAGTLQVARWGHTATLLQTGEVLIVGGRSSPFEYPSTVELFNPEDGTWRGTSSFALPRMDHTASLLPSGKVLIAGGHHSGGNLKRCDIYDPTTRSWYRTDSLDDSHASHTATVLRDGRVLVVGESAELFAPELEMWTSTPAPKIPRENHSATLLPSGSILVAGGSDNSDDGISGVEIYDPTTESWSDGDPLGASRSRHTATLLPTGRVLITGGFDEQPVPSTEIYGPNNGSWSAAPFLIPGRASHSATLLSSGKILVAGGRLDGGGFSSSADLFDPFFGSWTAAAPMNTARANHTATLLSTGKVLVVGGEVDFEGLDSAEIYDPILDEWDDDFASMESGRWDHSATLLSSGKVLVVGGKQDFTTVFAAAEIFDPADRTWTGAGSLSTPRSQHSSTLLPSGEVLIAGGRSGSEPSGDADLYDSSSGLWRPTGHLGTPRYRHTATLLQSGQVLVTGGLDGGPTATSTAELFEPATGDWRSLDHLATPRSHHTATLLPSGNVLVVGGFNVSTAELYDPAIDQWESAGSISADRRLHSATLLPSGNVLVLGGWGDGDPASGELYSPDVPPGHQRPILYASSDTVLEFGKSFVLEGDFLRGNSEAGGGGTRNSAVNYPIAQLRSVLDGRWTRLIPDSQPDPLADPVPGPMVDPQEVTFSRLPSSLEPGPHFLTVSTAGLTSDPIAVDVACSIAIIEQPEDATQDLLATATFTAKVEGARSLQWRRDGADISGANDTTYVTPPILAADAGTVYTLFADNGCTSAESEPAVLRVRDDTRPEAEVLDPNGGEYWLLSEAGAEPNEELITWSMFDDIRICRVEVNLRASNDGGVNFDTVLGSNLPAIFGSGGACSHADRVEVTSLLYSVPTEPPSGTAGSLYEIQVLVTDHAGNTEEARSPSPFFIVKPNPENIRTLILTNIPRMLKEDTHQRQAEMLQDHLIDLAHHPKVNGLIVDLSWDTDLNTLYESWDDWPSDPRLANRVLFGCSEGCNEGEPGAQDGIQDRIHDLLRAYAGVTSIVLVGDDQVIPMARVQDRTVLFSEENYPGEGPSADLSPDRSTVGQALAGMQYLSDDPFGIRSAITPSDLSDNAEDKVFIPELAVGRLIETPEEIITTISTFISQNGALNLRRPDPFDPDQNHRVLITGYDFLSDTAERVATRWQAALGQGDPDALDPVDSQLTNQGWDADELMEHLCGNGGEPYGLINLNGHASHYVEGIPGSDPHEIVGLDASRLIDPLACNGGPLDLSGRVVFAVGCHGGLPVPGSDPTDVDHSLDLPQAFLSRGVVAYIANSGYGWGLRHGIGYSERLMEIFNEEMALPGPIVVGQAVLNAKRRYFLEAPTFDPYDEKSLLQWTLFGLPMYTVDSGIDEGAPSSLISPEIPQRSNVETPGVTVTRWSDSDSGSGKGITTPSPYLEPLGLQFDLRALGIHKKYNASGDVLENVDGCPEPAPGEPEGCYYTYNNQVERGTGGTDLPIQPYFIYDSRRSNTSQHGILWMGGEYEEETDWHGLVAELVSNGGDGSDHGVSPQTATSPPTGRRISFGKDQSDCRATDLELNSMVITTGEAAKSDPDDQIWSIQRLFRRVDVEILYFNNTSDPLENCDRAGPTFEEGPFEDLYHQVSATTVHWQVPVSDPSDVWRVVILYNSGTVEDDSGENIGRWIPVELTETEQGGAWQGSLSLPEPGRLTYLVQAVDQRGNVSWLPFTTADLPASGVELKLPLPVEVEVVPGITDLAVTLSDSPDPVTTGGPLIHAALVSNNGPEPASSIRVDFKPNVLSSVTLMWGEGWNCEWQEDPHCTLAFLETGENAPPITILSQTPGVIGSLVNVVSVTAVQTDPDLTNNSASESTDVDHDFLAMNELANPGFDSGLEDWLLTLPATAAMTHVEEDVDGSPASGSVRVILGPDSEPAALSQCVLGDPGETLALGGTTKIESADSRQPVVYSLLEAYTSSDCSGDPIAEELKPVFSGGSGGEWQSFPMSGFEVPEGTQSLLFSLVAHNGSPVEVELFFDGIFLVPALFFDGFETGNTESWSAGGAP